MNEIAEIEAFIEALLAAVEEILASGEYFPDELANEVANVIEAEYRRLDELREQAAPTEPTPRPTTAGHPSSQINATSYNPKTREMLVKFQDKYPGQNGPVYRYQGVEPGTYSQFSAGVIPPTTTGSNAWHAWKKGVSPSLGASFNALIRDQAPYQKVS